MLPKGPSRAPRGLAMIDRVTCERLVAVMVRFASSRGSFQLWVTVPARSASMQRRDDGGARSVHVTLSDAELVELVRLANAVSADEQARVIEDHLFAMFDETVQVQRQAETIRVTNSHGALPDGPAADLLAWGRRLLDRHLP
jgi:hypothetical protein